ncbi:UNVERIFIED_ORG: hypothetical protein J2X79_001946 [Arthrobacter globiformis]|nr:hypothetical protein [Arthrobacter globiformis]
MVGGAALERSCRALQKCLYDGAPCDAINGSKDIRELARSTFTAPPLRVSPNSWRAAVRYGGRNVMLVVTDPRPGAAA